MKTKIICIVSLVMAAATLGLMAQTAPAQTATAPATVPAWTAGPAWSLTPEQLAQRRQMVQNTLADLRAKRDNGTITANENAWLGRMEQAGGLCVNGVPRGTQGAGQGLRNGTGPRAQMGLCPYATAATTTANATVSNATNANTSMAPAVWGGRGFGRGFCGGRGWGRGGGFGPRNGTGPRAQNGTCPLLNPAYSN
ncbi:MAG: hypothetical protein M1608_09565 [Candidatus Omnitrophica bacterium]|nr:hypothetical protein [Candidatus Omnitrophota bacterium]